MGLTRGDVLELLGELESEKDVLSLLMEDGNASSESKQAVNPVFDLMEELSEFKADVSRIFSTKAAALLEKVVQDAYLLPSSMDVSEPRSSMDPSPKHES